MKDVDRVVIAKPVASRPTCSGFRSFSELLAGAINASPAPANACSDMEVSAIRPKTVRAKPAVNSNSQSTISQAGVSEAVACSSSENNVNIQNQATMVFKPMAKVVSKATYSLLASMGSSIITHEQVLPQVDVCSQLAHQDKFHLISSQYSGNLPQVGPPQPVEPPKMAHQMLDEEHKMAASSSANTDRASGDGYNWRKYGQKQVKGSEYPRSYYKCTHPNCPVKKKVERSFDGHIVEIVYKGEHSHPKPHPLKRSTSALQGQGLLNDATGQDYNSNDPKLGKNICERDEGPDGKTESQNDVRFSKQSTFAGTSLLSHDPEDTGKNKTASGATEDSAGPSGEYEEGTHGLEVDDDELKIKKRKHDRQNAEAETSEKVLQEPRIWVQNNTDPEIMGDGYRWRKYGQKVVKGNPHPRSYYQCTSLKCNVRKHVERALDDPTAFITTYEGRHNHERPIKSTLSSVASEPDS